jgi:hypothetical protein
LTNNDAARSVRAIQQNITERLQSCDTPDEKGKKNKNTSNPFLDI